MWSHERFAVWLWKQSLLGIIFQIMFNPSFDTVFSPRGEVAKVWFLRFYKKLSYFSEKSESLLHLTKFPPENFAAVHESPSVLPSVQLSSGGGKGRYRHLLLNLDILMQPLLPRGYAILLLPFKLPVCWIQLDLKSVPWLLRWVTCYLLEGGIKNMGLKTILMPPEKKGDCALLSRWTNRTFWWCIKVRSRVGSIKNHKAALWACMLAKSEIIFR